LAAFQLITYGRFWVFTEGRNTDRCVLAIAVAWSGYRILSGAPELDAAKQGLALVFVGMTITTILNVVVPRRSKPSG
jgi:hypothetical protein